MGPWQYLWATLRSTPKRQRRKRAAAQLRRQYNTRQQEDALLDELNATRPRAVRERRNG